MDRAHLLTDDSLHRAGLYVGLTRGPETNHLYVVTNDTPDNDVVEAHHHPGRHGEDAPLADPLELFAQIVARGDDNLAATEVLGDHADDTTRLRTIHGDIVTTLGSDCAGYLLDRALPAAQHTEIAASGHYQDVLATIATADAHGLDARALVTAITDPRTPDPDLVVDPLTGGPRPRRGPAVPRRHLDQHPPPRPGPRHRWGAAPRWVPGAARPAHRPPPRRHPGPTPRHGHRPRRPRGLPRRGASPGWKRLRPPPTVASLPISCGRTPSGLSATPTSTVASPTPVTSTTRSPSRGSSTPPPATSPASPPWASVNGPGGGHCPGSRPRPRPSSARNWTLPHRNDPRAVWRWGLRSTRPKPPGSEPSVTAAWTAATATSCRAAAAHGPDAAGIHRDLTAFLDLARNAD